MLLVSRTLAEFAKQQLIWVTQKAHEMKTARRRGQPLRHAQRQRKGEGQGCNTQISFSLTDSVSSTLVGLELLSELLSQPAGPCTTFTAFLLRWPLFSHHPLFINSHMKIKKSLQTRAAEIRKLEQEACFNQVLLQPIQLWKQKWNY